MEKKFTGGEWHANESFGGRNWHIRAGEDEIFLANIGDAHTSSKETKLSGNEILANANLIASAPQLLSALEDIISLFDNGELAEMVDADTKDVFSLVRIKMQIGRLAVKKAYEGWTFRKLTTEKVDCPLCIQTLENCKNTRRSEYTKKRKP